MTRNHQRADYETYRAEARACGYEVQTFKDWLGVDSPKRRAMARYSRYASLSDACYYGDTY